MIVLFEKKKTNNIWYLWRKINKLMIIIINEKLFM